MDPVTTIKFVLTNSVYFVMPFTMCVTVILLFDKIALSLGAVDRPDDRKRHLSDIPVLGGVAIYLSFAYAIATMLPGSQMLYLLALCLVLVGLGLADDLVKLRAVTRLLVQGAIALLMINLAEIRIVELGDLLGSGSLILGFSISLVFTILCTIGVMNSINMIDGIDGLAGTLLLISLVAMAGLAWSAGEIRELKVLVILMGAIAGFLCFNTRIFVKTAKIFMGDAGSLFLGFFLCWHLIKLSHGETAPLSTIGAGWLFGLPLMDTISVIVRRAIAGNSPFEAGRDHIHHRLLDSGFSVGQTVCLLATVHAVFVGIGVLVSVYRHLEFPLFWVFIIFTIAHHWVTPSLVHHLTKKNRISAA